MTLTEPPHCAQVSTGPRSDQALFVFCVYAIQEQHMEMGSAISIYAWFVSVVLAAAALVWFID